ncbi:MAG: Spy/CpxP family protein refolding chaperone [Alphaproteobacteria bacterium]
MTTFTNSLRRTVAAAALLGVLAGPAYAATGDTVTLQKESPASMKEAWGKMSPEERGEAHNQKLHDELGITAAQEAQWKVVAQVMHDNHAAMRASFAERHKEGESASALDNLRFQQKMAQSHAEGVGKLLTAFEPLYNSMSEEQKKAADASFGKFKGGGKGEHRFGGKGGGHGRSMREGQ